jgi:plasmid stabilization system protein ParE
VRRLLWSDDALDDFVEAIAFITRASPASADVVADRIDAAAEALRKCASAVQVESLEHTKNSF